MINFNELRVMWLLNHTTARNFEIRMLKLMGISEIYTPKSYPQDQSFRTASIDYSSDAELRIPDQDMKILNQTNWYGRVSVDVWKLVNKYFDVMFLLPMNKEALEGVSRNFQGIVIWRVYGRDRSASYDLVLNDYIASGGRGGAYVRSLGRRFYFGEAYPHIADSEPLYLRDRRLYLPLGMANVAMKNNWEGNKKVLYFVCPEIESSLIYREIYRNFKSAFIGVAYIIAGAQPIAVPDKDVLGYVSDEEHVNNMIQSRVMYYHSQEPNHIHYHPFEAIRAGMPLVFMAGGMLDRMGGLGLPGRSVSVAEARRKIERIIGDDWELIERIRSSQTVLLEAMKPENCEPSWRTGFMRVASELETWRSERAKRPVRLNRRKVAVIVPGWRRGEDLSGAFALTKALYIGSRQFNEDVDIVLMHLDDTVAYPEEAFFTCPEMIARRSFNWKILSADESRRAMRYAGYFNWEPAFQNYMVPDDGMQQAMDCDLWLILSDRLSHAILPVKPIVLIVDGYLQRYLDLLPHGADQPFLEAARSAEMVLVTTQFAKVDALQYAGIDPNKLCKVPILAPEFPIRRALDNCQIGSLQYFVWATSSKHNNNQHTVEALAIYYDELDGQWECKISGVKTKDTCGDAFGDQNVIGDIFKHSIKLRRRVSWIGDVAKSRYHEVLANAGFLWHTAAIDNGTFSVVEAACLGVPSLSSNYPAMSEIDQQFSLNLAWMNQDSPRDMAIQLKQMEINSVARRDLIPNEMLLKAQRIDHHAKAYWQELRSCL